MINMNSSKSILYICMLLGMLISSCAETASLATTISFNSNAKARSVFDTGLIKSVKLINLESDGCVVGSIDKIISNDSLLYIMDKSVTNEVYIYTREGHYVNKISRYGHGKNEYSQLWDIFFDINKNNLCLVSRADQKILTFSPDGKKVLGETKLPKMFGHILPTANGYVGYMDNYSQNPNMPYNVWTTDNSFNLLESFFRIDPQVESSTIFEVNTMSVFADTLLYKPEYRNTIYQIKDGKASERYKLDFGEKTFPDLSSVSRENKTEWLRLLGEKIDNIFYFVETNDCLLMDFVMDGQFHLGIYNKKNHTSEIVRLDCYQDKYVFSFGQIKGMDQSAIYSAVDYEGVYNMWLGHNEYCNFEKLYPNQVNNLRRLFPKLEENGNPFIAIYSLK